MAGDLFVAIEPGFRWRHDAATSPVVMRGGAILLLLFGPSGSGKTTVLRAIAGSVALPRVIRLTARGGSTRARTSSATQRRSGTVQEPRSFRPHRAG